MARFSECDDADDGSKATGTDRMLPKRSCGTCRDRRVKCDRTAPTCLQCTRARKECKGYGLRLSWPRAGDNRRAVVMKSTSRMVKTGRHIILDASLVPSHSCDVELHYRLTTSPSTSGTLPRFPHILRIPMAFNPIKWETTDHLNLFQYFQHVASRSLTTFGQDPSNLSQILMRVALTGNTPSSTAVLRSLLALSSLHRNGLQAQAFELKIASLKALAAASRSRLGQMELIQHVAAGMLLCSIEIHQTSCTSSHWTWYIQGIKEILSGPGRKACPPDREFDTLTNWVYYHDVIARFTMQHWIGRTTRLPPDPPSFCYEVEVPSKVIPMNSLLSSLCRTAPSAASKIMILLSEVCDAVTTKSHGAAMSTEESDNYKNMLTILEWKVRSVPLSAGTETCPDVGPVRTLDLYRLAIYVYLNRATGNKLDQPTRLQEHIDKAFVILSGLKSCERQFPLFILGSEARTDTQRAIILDLISRTEKDPSSRSLTQVKILIQAMWAQDDLADEELSYRDKITGIISSCNIVPSFV